MATPSDRVYSDTHEWYADAGGIVTVGITRHAVDELTDITYVELKPVGTSVEPGESVGEVESVKSTGDVVSAVGGEIIEINTELDDSPGTLNDDPYDAGWLVRIRAEDTGPLAALMDADAYDQHAGG